MMAITTSNSISVNPDFRVLSDVIVEAPVTGSRTTLVGRPRHRHYIIADPVSFTNTMI
jgi:hypothetical protein